MSAMVRSIIGCSIKLLLFFFFHHNYNKNIYSSSLRFNTYIRILRLVP